MARLNAAHVTELRELATQATAVVAEFTARDQLGSLSDHFHVAVHNAVAAHNLRGLRIIVQELGTMIGSLPPEEQPDFIRAAEHRCGYSLEAWFRREREAAEAIVARGRIRNDREFYTLRSYVDRIEAGKPESPERSAAYRLLDEYGT